ncbi:MAG: hypothetical protein ABUL62_19415 [Myxococcales bacterium]
MTAFDSGKPLTPSSLLRCDRCGRDVRDLEADIAFTHMSDVEPAPALFLLCKARRCHLTQNLLGSLEAHYFADHVAGLTFAADVSGYARLTADQWRRWIQLLWAIAVVATPEQQRRSREALEHTRS